MKGVIFLSKSLNNVKINVNFTEASSRKNLATGESLPTLFGKIKKVITDLHDSAFTGNADKVNSHTVDADVPPNAVFTDTVYTHPTTAGNKHIPAGGSTGQILRWSASGTAVWGSESAHAAFITVELSSSGWSSNSQSVPASGVTASNNIIISPTIESQEKYMASGITCTAQAANSLTFACDTVPSESLTVNVFILS